jgi:hypothetical protein
MDNKVAIVETPTLGVNGKVDAPNNVVTAYSQANQIYQLMEQELSSRYAGYEKVRKLKAGNPPIDPQKLKDAGLEYLSNTNWREYASESRKVETSLIQAISGRTLVDFKVKKYDYKQNLLFSEKLSQIFSEKIRDWPKYNKNIKAHLSRVVDYGLAILFFPNPTSPDFLPISPENFLFPHEGKLDFDFLPYCGIKHKYDPQFLFEVYENAKVGSAWEKDAIAQLLYTSSRYGRDVKLAEQTGVFSFKDLALRINNRHDYFAESFNGPIEVVTELVREYDGKVTKVIFSPNHGEVGLLYFKNRAYKSYEEAIVIFTFKDDIEFLTEAKGFGQDQYNSFHQLNHLNNSVVNTVRLGGTKFFRNTGGDATTAKRIKVVPSGFNILPAGIEPAEFNWNPNVGHYVEGVSFLKTIQHSASPHLESNKIPSSDVKSQVVRDPQDRIKAIRVQKQEVQGFLEQMDIFLRILVGKILNDKSCPVYKEILVEWEREGLPTDFFDFKDTDKFGIPKSVSVSASRIVLYEQEQIAALYANAQVLDSRAYRRLLKLFVESQTDQWMADYLLPDEEAEGSPTEHYTGAAMMANQIEEEKQVPWSPDLDHEAVMDVFLDRCEQWIQRYNEAEDQLEVLGATAKALFGLISFAASSKQYLLRDRTKKDKNEYYNQRFYQIVGISNGIYANAEKNQEAIVRKQMELNNAKSGDPKDPKVLDVLINAELKKLKQATEGQMMAAGQQIKFATKQAEIAQQGVLSIEEQKAKQAREHQQMLKEEAREDIKAVREIQREDFKAANEVRSRAD